MSTQAESPPDLPKPSICFVAPNNYGVLDAGANLTHIGGAEVQRALIARRLAQRGYPVSFITWDHGQSDGIEHNDIRIFKMCPASAGLPFLRFVYPRWSSLWSALSRADADIYYQRTAGSESGQVAQWCRWRKRRLVLGIASDPECDRRLPHLGRRERWFFKYALRRADAIVTQTRCQQRVLRKHLGINARMIRNCASDPGIGHGGRQEVFLQRRVLWIGRFGAEKSPEFLLKLAQLCPSVNFDVIGSANAPNEQMQAIMRQLRSLDNTTVHGFVRHDDIGDIVDRTTLVICTSVFEGFPNTFLEAWSRGVPAVSTVDPDGIIRRHGLGAVAERVCSFSEAIHRMLDSEEYWRRSGHRAREFFMAHHTIEAVVTAYEELFCELMEGQSHPSARRAFNGPPLLKGGHDVQSSSRQRTAVIEHFDTRSSEWSMHYLDRPREISELDLTNRRSAALRFLKHVRDSRTGQLTILDVGCGSGDVLPSLDSKGWKVFGVDIAPAMVCAAAQQIPGGQFSVADAVNLPFGAESFDVVTCLGVLEYIPDWGAALHEMQSVLKPGGCLIVSFPNRQSLFRRCGHLERRVLNAIRAMIPTRRYRNPQSSYMRHEWTTKESQRILRQHGLPIRDSQFVTYGLKGRMGDHSKANLAIACRLRGRWVRESWLSRNLAWTAIYWCVKVDS